MATGPVVLPWVSFEAPRNCIWGHPSISLASLHTQPALKCVLYQILTELERHPPPAPTLNISARITHFCAVLIPEQNWDFSICLLTKALRLQAQVRCTRPGRRTREALCCRTAHGRRRLPTIPEPRNSWIKRFATHTAHGGAPAAAKAARPLATYSFRPRHLQDGGYARKGGRRRVDKEGGTATDICIFSY